MTFDATCKNCRSMILPSDYISAGESLGLAKRRERDHRREPYQPELKAMMKCRWRYFYPMLQGSAGTLAACSTPPINTLSILNGKTWNKKCVAIHRWKYLHACLQRGSDCFSCETIFFSKSPATTVLERRCLDWGPDVALAGVWAVSYSSDAHSAIWQTLTCRLPCTPRLLILISSSWSAQMLACKFLNFCKSQADVMSNKI